jgi:hypothetical protein
MSPPSVSAFISGKCTFARLLIASDVSSSAPIQAFRGPDDDNPADDPGASECDISDAFSEMGGHEEISERGVTMM